jgi:hypothetical protein
VKSLRKLSHCVVISSRPPTVAEKVNDVPHSPMNWPRLQLLGRHGT